MPEPTPIPQKDKDEVSALARGLSVLRAVAQSPRALSNRELADATGIPKATVSRLAATLVAGGFLKQMADSERFGLSAAILELSNAYLQNFDLRSLARLHLADLAEHAGAAVHLGVRDELDIVLIDHIRPRSAVVLSSLDIGARLSMATSATGRAYLATVDEAERQQLFAAIRATSGSRWKAVKAGLDAAIEAYASQGYCSSFGDWHRDIHALGLTLRGPRGELYAVSCGGPAYLLPPKLMAEKIAPRLLAAARAIAQEAGTVNVA